MHLACQKNSTTSKLSGNGRKDPNLPFTTEFWCFQNFFDKPNASSQKNNFFYCIWLAQKIWKHQNSVVMAD
ncbi:unnamed protein product [Blepharisma stoltei]|uniref:Uncharacterized protein n=1 Tax=Blepharisma stoltei TaxID=1481888 RepID=A0AAU9JP06_9CILI|nr:unnamed protein product [Blepharisma stoltei]